MASFAFWYVFATDGTNGFLLDLVRRPSESLARLVTYGQDRPPRIVRHGFQPNDLNGVPDALGVTLGGIALDALRCRSALPRMSIDARFALNGFSRVLFPASSPGGSITFPTSAPGMALSSKAPAKARYIGMRRSPVPPIHWTRSLAPAGS